MRGGEMRSGDWQDATYEQIRQDAEVLAERIRVFDSMLEATSDETERQLISGQLARLHNDYNSIIAQRDRMAENVPKEKRPIPKDTTAQPLEHRVSTLERDVEWLKQLVQPGARRVAGKMIFWGLLVIAWSMWIIGEIRAWLLLHPVQAIVITLALGLAALIVRWLPEEDHHDQR